jgi:hypothetical protein
MLAYAYLHCRPDGSPFYVGKGKLRRVNNLTERNPYHAAIVSKYGQKNILIGKLACSSDQIAYSLEKGFIKCLRRSGIKLANFTDGGEGGSNPCEETRKRLSEAAKRRGISEATHIAKVKAKTGVPLSEETKAKLRARVGRVFSEEHRKNISVSAKKRGMSPLILEAAHKACRGRKWSDEERKNRAEARIIRNKNK